MALLPTGLILLYKCFIRIWFDGDGRRESLII